MTGRNGKNNNLRHKLQRAVDAQRKAWDAQFDLAQDFDDSLADAVSDFVRGLAFEQLYGAKAEKIKDADIKQLRGWIREEQRRWAAHLRNARQGMGDTGDLFSFLFDERNPNDDQQAQKVSVPQP